MKFLRKIKQFFCSHNFMASYFGMNKIGYVCVHCPKTKYEDRNGRSNGEVFLESVGVETGENDE